MEFRAPENAQVGPRLLLGRRLGGLDGDSVHGALAVATRRLQPERDFARTFAAGDAGGEPRLHAVADGVEVSSVDRQRTQTLTVDQPALRRGSTGSLLGQCTAMLLGFGERRRARIEDHAPRMHALRDPVPAVVRFLTCA